MVCGVLIYVGYEIYIFLFNVYIFFWYIILYKKIREVRLLDMILLNW